MPAKSQAQREYLNARFGHAWVVAHGFDNKGPLPEHVKRKHRAGRSARGSAVAKMLAGHMAGR